MMMMNSDIDSSDCRPEAYYKLKKCNINININYKFKTVTINILYYCIMVQVTDT